MSKTEVVHVEKDTYDVYIGRGNGGQRQIDMSNTEPTNRGWLGNPHPTEDDRKCPYCNKYHTREKAIQLYREDFYQKIENNAEFRRSVNDLKGKTLGCWCRPEKCHGDVIVAYLGDGNPTSIFEY